MVWNVPEILGLVPDGSAGKESACSAGDTGFDPWVRKIPWRRKWQPTPVFLPGKSHRQRSLAVYSPRGRKESDTGSEPEAGRAGTQFVLHPEFSISMASMQMLWPQAPGEPGPSVLWCMAALQWPAGLHCPSLSWALPAWEGGGAWRLRAPTSQGSAEIIRVPEPL